MPSSLKRAMVWERLIQTYHCSMDPLQGSVYKFGVYLTCMPHRFMASRFKIYSDICNLISDISNSISEISNSFSDRPISNSISGICIRVSGI